MNSEMGIKMALGWYWITVGNRLCNSIPCIPEWYIGYSWNFGAGLYRLIAVIAIVAIVVAIINRTNKKFRLGKLNAN